MSQKISVLRYLKKRPITAITALNRLGCFRLAAVIHLLRGDGHVIDTVMIGSGSKQYARYTLVAEHKERK
jgi:hypothetical protein